MKASKKIKCAGAFLTLLMASATLIGFHFIPDVRAQPLPVVSITAPDTVDVEETKKFNVTVWLTGSVDNILFYQIYMTVDDSIVSIDRAWVPDWDSSWIFHGEFAFSPEPVFFDTNVNGVSEAVQLGSSLMMEGMPFSGTSLLVKVELLIMSSPRTAVLGINNTDTFVVDEDEVDVAIEIQDKSVNIVGIPAAEPSEITIDVNPTTAFVGQNVTITGRITPDKPGVDVKIEWKPEPQMSWSLVATVKTNQTSQYKLIHKFSAQGSPQLRASWIGDATHQGDTSESVKVTVTRAYTSLEIRNAEDETDYSIGHAEELLPTPVPTTFNVTVFNVTDLYEWKIKIYYNSIFLGVRSIDDIWIPPDNIFSLNGLTYSSAIDLGVDEHGDYIYCEAAITGGDNCSGDGTLFQFNLTGMFRTGEQATLLDLEPVLKDSKGNEILFEYDDFPVSVLGIFPTSVEMTNPETGENLFTFYSEDTSVGIIFNATVSVRQAIDLAGWRMQMTYNNTLLNVTNVIQPIEDPDYVFGVNSNFAWSNENGTLQIQDILDESAESFTGDGLLTIIEFKILLAPTNETEELSCPLRFEKFEAFSAISKLWQNVDRTHGVYSFRYGASGEDGTGGLVESIWDYWPYIVGVIVAIIVVYLVVRKVKKRQELYIEEEEEDWEEELET